MENEIKIRFGIETIEDQKFKLSDSIPQEIKPVWCVTPCNFLHQPGPSIRSA